MSILVEIKTDIGQEQDICEHMEQLVSDMHIFEGALSFVRIHSGETIELGNKQLCEILLILEKEARRIAAEANKIELLMIRED